MSNMKVNQSNTASSATSAGVRESVKPAEAKMADRISQVAKKWETANVNSSMSSDARKDMKIRDFIGIIDEMAEVNPDMRDQIEGVKHEFKKFQSDKNAVSTLLTIALNYVDGLPARINALTDRDLCDNTYRSTRRSLPVEDDARLSSLE